MENITIKQTITILPSQFSNKIRENILKNISEKLTNTCLKEYGVITKVEKIEKLLSTEICTITANIIVEALISVQVFKPVIGKCLRGTIVFIDKNCIIVNKLGGITVCIPQSKIDNYKFTDNCYKYKKKTLEKDDEIEFFLYEVMFKNNNFQCLGCIKDYPQLGKIHKAKVLSSGQETIVTINKKCVKLLDVENLEPDTEIKVVLKNIQYMEREKMYTCLGDLKE
jgi:DNA-directed RNA polymerase subunit E'/Rpb7